MAREERLERLEEVVVVGAEDVLRAHQSVLARLRVVVEPLDVREEHVELLVRQPQPRLPEKVLAVEVRRLEREVKRLKGEKHEGKDEILALLDEAS